VPLAIELAATWMHALTPAEVVAELARSLDFLSTSRRGDAAAQRGLRAVFDHSYARLSPGEQRAIRAMSVLAGGITRASARAVAAAPPDVLRALVDRSFLRFDPTLGRYSMHEVLRHYAGVRLGEQPEEHDAARRRQQQHLATLVAELDEALVARGERDALDAVAAEADNLRSAWARALAAGDTVFVAAVLPAMAVLCEARGWYREGERLAGEAVELLRRADGEGRRDRTPIARALVRRGGLRNRLARYDDAAADLTEALTLLGETSDGDRAAALFHLGDAALWQGRFAEAHELLQRSQALAEASGSVRVLGDGLARLGRAVLDEGRHAEARALFEASLAVGRRIGNQHAVIYAANQLGYVDYFGGDLDSAGARFAETLQWAREADDPAATVSALNGLAYVAEDRGELDRASDLYRQSLALAQEQGDRFAAGRVLMLIGEVARKQGRLAEARQHVIAALREYRASGSFTVALPAVIGLAEVAHAEADDERALALLGLVLGHPGNRQDHRPECERVLAKITVRSGEGVVERGLARGSALDLEVLVDEVLSPAPAKPKRGRHVRARTVSTPSTS